MDWCRVATREGGVRKPPADGSLEFAASQCRRVLRSCPRSHEGRHPRLSVRDTFSVCDGCARGKPALAVGRAAAAAPASVAGPSRSFSDVVDLTHPLYEGFPTFDGSYAFTHEPFRHMQEINLTSIAGWSSSIPARTIDAPAAAPRPTACKASICCR